MVSATSLSAPAHTLWGLTPLQLHDRFWASRATQVVRHGEPAELVGHAELYLLTDPRTLCLFSLASILDEVSWLSPTVCVIRLVDARNHGYREIVSADGEGRFGRFRRVYGGADAHVARVAITRDADVAGAWQSEPDSRTAWRNLRESLPRAERHAVSLRGRVFDGSRETDLARFVRELAQRWQRPDVTVDRLRPVVGGVWADHSAAVDSKAVVTGPVWIGAGRSLPAGASAVGPSVMWDDPVARPAPPDIRWLDLEPISPLHRPVVRTLPPLAQTAKRAFDIVFSLLALAVTLPLYPLLMAAVVLEDGFPIFFGHKRETVGGRQFDCYKFRSMRRDADKIKAQLLRENQADGPQFFIENDPRMTRVGHYLRKYQLDELPQFWNVLKGDMSIVGPRPSPFNENQFCPGWREARLSVRPGVTGLWQVHRTRKSGADFQEWIRYDIEYVEKQSFWLDMVIIWKTVAMLLSRFTKP